MGYASSTTTPSARIKAVCVSTPRVNSRFSNSSHLNRHSKTRSQPSRWAAQKEAATSRLAEKVTEVMRFCQAFMTEFVATHGPDTDVPQETSAWRARSRLHVWHVQENGPRIYRHIHRQGTRIGRLENPSRGKQATATFYFFLKC